MNWLAHVFLSEPDVECRLGNLLADLIKGRARQGLSANFHRGFRCHQVIDAFTDYHPLVGRSRGRIAPQYGRFAGILTDVFYDHFLARDWARYSPIPLDEFTAEVYSALRAFPVELPPEARETVARMIASDPLGSYRHVAGIEAALRRVSGRLTERLKRPFALEQAIDELTTHEEGLAADFAEFFPQLQAHVARWQTAQDALLHGEGAD